MKLSLILSLGLLGLAACSGSADSSTSATSGNLSTLATAPNADPRIAQIQALHEQLLALQKPFSDTENQIDALQAELNKEKNSEMLQRDKDLPDRHREYANLVATSKTDMSTLSQLDQGKSQDVTQAQLIGESLEREKAMVNRATELVEKNRTMISFFEKGAAFRKSQKGK